MSYSLRESTVSRRSNRSGPSYRGSRIADARLLPHSRAVSSVIILSTMLLGSASAQAPRRAALSGTRTVPFMLAQPATTQAITSHESVTLVSRDDATDAGEPITYPVGGSPEVTSAILTVPPGGKTEWMTHPVPGYVYVLEGTLTVEFEDGHRLTFHSGQGFLQARTKWHRGINQGTAPLRFLAVFFGAKGVPIILHPPKPDPGATQR